MGLAAWLGLKPKDVGALAVSDRSAEQPGPVQAAPGSQPQAAAKAPAYVPLTTTLNPAHMAVPQSMRNAAADAAPVEVKHHRGKQRKREESLDPCSPLLSATAQDHEDWLRERSMRNPTDRRPGMTVREEYEQWLKVRFRSRAGQAPGALRQAAR